MFSDNSSNKGVILGKEIGTTWIDPKIDWRKGKIVTMGIDVGSVSSQSVVMVDGRLLAYANLRTGFSSSSSAENVLSLVLEKAGLPANRIDYCVGTGYGRSNISGANKIISEIACHARGSHYIYGKKVRTVLDIGGQDCKVIRCDENGRVLKFIMNDKCAAGTGRGIEVLADLFGVPVEKVGALSLLVKGEPEPLSSMCVIYAKSEALNLADSGWELNEILAAFLLALAKRLHSMLLTIGVEKEFAITGGVAKNEGVTKRLARIMKIKPLKPSLDPQIAGAVGACLFAHSIAKGDKIE